MSLDRRGLRVKRACAEETFKVSPMYFCNLGDQRAQQSEEDHVASLCYDTGTMIQLDLDNSQRKLLSEQLASTGQYSFAGLFVVQLATGFPNPWLLFLGFFWYLWLVILAIRIRRGVKE